MASASKCSVIFCEQKPITNCFIAFKLCFMAKTITILLITIIVLPFVALKFDPHPLNDAQSHMVFVSGFMALAVGLICFAVAELTGNCSQVDKIWSIMPIVYTWYFAAASDWNGRVVLMAICATVWGIRLTYNFGRRGAYKLKFWEGHEDYRWEVLRQNALFKNKPLNWKLFNLFFISLYQNALIWLFTLPAAMAYTSQPKALNTVDYFLALLFIVLVIVETIADQQQWNFQTEKYRRIQAGESLSDEYKAGFISSGLWRIVRHPNYACEQAIWIVFYVFTIYATGSIINWSMAGALLLLILFQGSSDFSEEISAGKYPLYKEYQNKTGRFLPKW